MFSQLTVGERLKMARRAAKYGGEELGRFIGVGKSQISNIENDKSELTRGNAIVLSEKLGVSLNWLLTGEGDMTELSRGTPAYNTGRNNTATNKVNIGGYSQTGDPVMAMLERQINDLKEELARCREQNEKLLERLLK